MIHVDWNSKIGSCDALISCHCEEELRTNFETLLGAVFKEPEVTEIFLEEFNIYAKELEEKLRNGKNNSSD